MNSGNLCPLSLHSDLPPEGLLTQHASPVPCDGYNAHLCCFLTPESPQEHPHAQATRRYVFHCRADEPCSIGNSGDVADQAQHYQHSKEIALSCRTHRPTCQMHRPRHDGGVQKLQATCRSQRSTHRKDNTGNSIQISHAFGVRLPSP